MFCKRCGKRVTSHQAFCKFCGAGITAQSNAIVATGRTPSGVARFLSKVLKGTLVVFGAIFLIAFLAALFSEFQATDITSDIIREPVNAKPVPVNAKPANFSFKQEDVAASVVNILCPDIYDDSNSSGGSGTIITNDGIILTNSHIIPQDAENLRVGEEGCLVILPDPITGRASEFYKARPIVLSEASEKYDLAFLQIYDAYYDSEEGRYVGTYPRVFPTFDDPSHCDGKTTQLGEALRIYGYPSISGGASLTVTEGVVSSFPGNGYIITSAKISHGNSGGLAVGLDGCSIGVPAMVNSDENESLGVIISGEIITLFADELNAVISQNGLE